MVGDGGQPPNALAIAQEVASMGAGRGAAGAKAREVNRLRRRKGSPWWGTHHDARRWLKPY